MEATNQQENLKIHVVDSAPNFILLQDAGGFGEQSVLVQGNFVLISDPTSPHVGRVGQVRSAKPSGFNSDWTVELDLLPVSVNSTVKCVIHRKNLRLLKRQDYVLHHTFGQFNPQSSLVASGAPREMRQDSETVDLTSRVNRLDLEPRNADPLDIIIKAVSIRGPSKSEQGASLQGNFFNFDPHSFLQRKGQHWPTITCTASVVRPVLKNTESILYYEDMFKGKTFQHKHALIYVKGVFIPPLCIKKIYEALEVKQKALHFPITASHKDALLAEACQSIYLLSEQELMNVELTSASAAAIKIQDYISFSEHQRNDLQEFDTKNEPLLQHRTVDGVASHYLDELVKDAMTIFGSHGFIHTVLRQQILNTVPITTNVFGVVAVSVAGANVYYKAREVKQQ